jgi:hypothetical protein
MADRAPDDKTDLTPRDGTRDGKGRYDRDPETVKRDAQAAALRARSWTYQRIGEELGISKQSAYDAVQRALRDTLQEPADDVRALELERLDGMYAAVLAVLERDHVTLYQGEVVRVEGAVLVDDGPVLSAVDRLLRIQERRAKLLGLDLPVKQQIEAEHTVRYQIGVTGEEMDAV